MQSTSGWVFRFPIALLSYTKDGPKGYHNAVEYARDWAIPLGKTRYKRPTLSEAQEYINNLIKDDKTAQEAKHTTYT